MDAVARINETTWKFVTADADGLRRKILELSLHHNLNIVSLQSQVAVVWKPYSGNSPKTAPANQAKTRKKSYQDFQLNKGSSLLTNFS
ncbi:MAG: hypothetical protein IPP79_12245 [Chitinophagaceae bacterium]|nr:hypothetical protein [Chitinophagaceae bacterium]